MSAIQRGITSKSTYSQEQLLAIWRKGRRIDGYDATQIRADEYGSAMRWEHYGQQTSFGWEVDHIRAVANGGSDDLDNLQPLQWENNRKKGDSR